MADNVTLDAMTGGDSVAADDIASVKYQRIKLIHGADGVNDGDVSSVNGFPVTLLANSGVDIGDVDVLTTPLDGAIYTDDADWTALSSEHFLMGGVYQSTPGTITDGDTGPLRVDPSGHLITSPHSESVALADAVSNTQNIIVDSASNFVPTAVFNFGFNGTTWDRLRSDTANGLDVDVTRMSALVTGSAAIGKLAANSGVDIGDVDILTMPVRDRTTDNQGVALQTDAIMDDTTVLTPKFAKIDAAASGDNTIVALVSGKKIRVLGGLLVAAGDVNVRFESGAAGTALTGQMNLTTNSGFAIPFNPLGNFESASGVLLNLELSAAISVDGWLTYVEV